MRKQEKVTIRKLYLIHPSPCIDVSRQRNFHTNARLRMYKYCYSNLGAISAKDLLSTGLSSLIYSISCIRQSSLLLHFGMLKWSWDSLAPCCVNVLMLSLFYLQQKKDARIIVGMFHENQARKVFCEVTGCQYVVCFSNLEYIERFHTCSTCATLQLDFLIN